MKISVALVPLALVVASMGNPLLPLLELQARQGGGSPPASSCNLSNCLLTIARSVLGIIQPCQAAGASLQQVDEAQRQGQQPSSAATLGLANNAFQCVAGAISAGLGIPGACNGCPGTTPPR